jgi:hypothetical protein
MAGFKLPTWVPDDHPNPGLLFAETLFSEPVCEALNRVGDGPSGLMLHRVILGHRENLDFPVTIDIVVLAREAGHSGKLFPFLLRETLTIGGVLPLPKIERAYSVASLNGHFEACQMLYEMSKQGLRGSPILKCTSNLAAKKGSLPMLQWAKG